MARRLLVIGMLIAAIFAGPPVASGAVFQRKLVAVKEAAGPFDLDGTYRCRILYVENFEDIDRGAVILVGSIEFDSVNGTWSSTGDMFLSDGSSWPDAGTGTYTVNADGSVEFINPNVGQTWHGDLSSDSKTLIMTLGDTDAGGDIRLSILVAIKDEGEPFTVADLYGTYRFRNLELHRFEHVDTDAVVTKAALECDGQGNWTAAYSCFVSNGSSESGTIVGTYSVNAQNSFEFTETGVPGVDFSADLSSDGNILILTKGTKDQSGDTSQWIGTAVKEDPNKTFTEANLSGNYHFRMLDFEDFETSEREATVAYGVLNFDGVGSWAATANSFDSDGEVDPVTVWGIYGVNPDGSFVLTTTSSTPNETTTGDISSDGEFLIMSLAEGVAIDGGNDWHNINGTVSYNGTPVCAMVLANGQHMFTCSGDGSFNLYVPLDGNGQITVFGFCSGLAPFERVIYPSEGQGMQIELADAEGVSSMDVTTTLTAINTTWVRLEGTVSYNGTPVCAMALANGQFMFTCSGDGSYILDVPLDDMGSITFFGFCSGLLPYKYVFTTEQISFNDDTDNDGYTISEGDSNDLDSSINPGG
jgi:hypothetical protein